MDQLDKLRKKLRDFSHEREWDQFHSPKNLSMALAGETGELLEILQWLTEEQSQNLTHEQLLAVKDEIADIFLYLVRFSDVLNIDIFNAAENKIIKNAEKYPVDKVKGSAKKYTEY